MRQKINKNAKLTTKNKLVPLYKIVRIPPKRYPSSNIEHDNIISDSYMPSASTLEIIKRFSAGLTGAKSGRMLSITGPYGSGKSTLAIFLNGLLAPKKSKEWQVACKILKRQPEKYANALIAARKKLNIHNTGMIRCTITARREPISVTILRALDLGLQKQFGRYNQKNIPSAKLLHKCIQDLKKGVIPKHSTILEIIEGITNTTPTLLMIDEFGKNIEYFNADDSQQSDLFLLQEIAEKTSRSKKLSLSIVTFQHMAFEEYAIGTSPVQKQEWSKIQGRFEDIPFANSPDQTRLLISNTIKRSSGEHARMIMNWAKIESKKIQDLGISTVSDPDLIASCYPLNPLALEVLPELCSRYGQYERTLLSFLSDNKKYTVATFINENYSQDGNLPTMGLDALYDYFISGTNMIYSSLMNTSRLMEIETIIRDAHGLDDSEKSALKIIGILNLIGRSGYLRASKRIIEYSLGHDDVLQTLKALEKKSIITYRNHTDEYRIWHGTDINISAKLDAYRKRYQQTSLPNLLKDTIKLEPVVAAKHSIETGTMRLFKQLFTFDGYLNENYDGIIIYNSSDSLPAHDKPIITVNASDTNDLRLAAIEVTAIQNILDSDEDVTIDWVARAELKERLVNAEVNLEREFEIAYSNTSKWSYTDKPKLKLEGTPSMMVSKVCDSAYSKTPPIHNEMINRNLLSSQGSMAMKLLMEYMLLNSNKPKFGIDGYGPERAVYEAVIFNNGIHTQDRSFGWSLQDPTNKNIIPLWNEILNSIKDSRKRVELSEIYTKCMCPPYGVKEGVLPLFIVPILLIYRNNIAIYEHGSYRPKIGPEIIERMIKNPNHFEVKYFNITTSKKKLIQTISKDLGIKSNDSMIAIVSHIVRIVSSLPSYVKKTKKLNNDTLAVKSAVISAIEPDVLLFDTLPKVLGFKPFTYKISDSDIKKFSKTLANSITILQNEFDKTLDDIINMLYASTGIPDRKKLSNSAKTMLNSVTDKTMNTFLTAISTDALEDDYDWIKYVALNLTDIPPADWRDEERMMFENRLKEISTQFSRLASIHFANIVDNLAKPSHQITITRADGSEDHKLISLQPDQKKKVEKQAKSIIRSIKKKGFTKNDRDALIVMLSSDNDL